MNKALFAAMAAGCIGWALIIGATTIAFASGAPSKIVGCMSLVSPDVLFCTDSSNRAVMCQTSDDKPACMTMTALYRSWRGHPERRELFYRKLYGATTP